MMYLTQFFFSFFLPFVCVHIVADLANLTPSFNFLITTLAKTCTHNLAYPIKRYAPSLHKISRNVIITLLIVVLLLSACARACASFTIHDWLFALGRFDWAPYDGISCAIITPNLKFGQLICNHHKFKCYILIMITSSGSAFSGDILFSS